MKYILLDLSNLYFRARHAAPRRADLNDRVGFAMHVTFASINKCWRLHNADHVVLALEGRSWRKALYKPYKNNRTLARAAQTKAEQEEDAAFWEGYLALNEFLANNTNCTTLQHPAAEGDDMIARWIALHPNDEHTIISSDTDFVQLLSTNVDQYNGITKERITINGIFDDRGKQVIDRKTKQPKTVPDPEWLLFEKCMRGDPTDNVFSAYPGVREKSSKNKTGLREAFNDRIWRGFSWNNLMLQRWVDPDGNEHKVIEDYERNRQLIDLTAQPKDLKEEFDATIQKACIVRNTPMIGAKFLKFCGKHELIALADNAQQYSEILSAKYR